MREGCLGNGIAFFASQSEEIRALWGSAGSGSTPGWAVPGEAHWHTGFVSAEGALSSTPAVALSPWQASAQGIKYATAFIY